MIKNIFFKKGPAKSIWILIQGAVVFSHGCICAIAGIAWFFWQDLQDFTVIPTSLSIFGPHTLEQARSFILIITGWFSWSSIKTFSLNWKGVTTLFPHIKQKLSTANSFLQKKYGFSCLFTLEGHPHKTKSITFEIIGSLFEISPISLDVTGAWISFVINT